MSSRGYALQVPAGPIMGSSYYQRVEDKVISTAVTTVDMDTTLDGDVDGGYIFCGNIDSDATTAPNIVLRINGADWAITRSVIIQSGGGVSAATNTTTTVIGLQATSGSVWTGEFRIYIPMSKSGQERYATVRGTKNGNNVNTLELVSYQAIITTPAKATNITSIGVSSSQTDGIGIGSRFRLYKLTN